MENNFVLILIFFDLVYIFFNLYVFKILVIKNYLYNVFKFRFNL